MASKAHRTNTTTKSKLERSPDACKKLLALGVPATLAPTWPLTPHPASQWCKKIKGKVWYFGSFADGWEAALNAYKDQVEDIEAGRMPTARNKDGMRLLELCDRFLDDKRGRVDEGSLTLHSWYDYHRTCGKLLAVLGQQRLVEDLGPQDFKKLRDDFGKCSWGLVKIGNEINRTRMVFRFGIEQGLIGKPIIFGNFKRIDRKTLRKHRAKQKAEHGPRMFTAPELRQILDTAPQPMKSMVLLGINGGLNNMDVATIYMSALDLDRGWLDFPRGKTGIPRRIPLWPETIASIRAYLAVRPEPKNPDDDKLVFLSRQRRPWYRLGRFVSDGKGGTVVKGIDNPVSKQFRAFLDKIGMNGRRNFLALRHGFRTIGRGARDREAIDALMGHVDESMASHYIEDGLPDDRLRAVTEFVRAWLFAGAAKR